MLLLIKKLIMVRDIFNLIYYIIFKWVYKIQTLLHYIDPMIWLRNIPFIKKKLTERGLNPIEISNNLWSDPDNGMGTWVASAVLGISILIYLSTSLSLVLSINNILSKYDIFMEVLYISAVISHIFVYFYLDSNNLHLKKNIKKFDKMKIKTKYKIYTFMFITFSPIYGYLTLAYFIFP